MGAVGGCSTAGARAAQPCVALVFRVGPRRCALPVAHVVETMRPLPVAGVAGVPPAVLGVAVIRGAPAPVVDLAQVMAVTDAGAPGRFVLVRVGGRRAALAVTEVLGVYALDAAVFEALSPLLRDEAGAVSAIGVHDREILSMLDGARVVPESAWDALRAAGA